MDTTYDYIVIGKGLMGAAAARYLSSISQGVALIGPDEPLDRASHQGIFGSHYDEGRITRILDRNRIWALLAQRSIARYRDIETESGIPFYHEVGHLAVGPRPPQADNYIAEVQQVAAELGVSYETYTDTTLRERFPYLAFETGSVGLYQPNCGGHVSPRSQVRAQATVAQKQGATLIAETVERLHPTPRYVEVHTDTGRCYRAENVLMATGGFSHAKPLLPRSLALSVYARTVVLMEVDAFEVARLRGMPSVIYKPREPADRCYILPPIQYPNGKTYLKIGGGYNDPVLSSLSDLQDWFRGPGSAEAARRLTDLLHSVVRDLTPVAIHTDSCVTTETVSGQVYVERLQDRRIGVLIGGNGSAAKSADEIGRMGALMMQHEAWSYDIAAKYFQAHFVSP